MVPSSVHEVQIQPLAFHNPSCRQGPRSLESSRWQPRKGQDSPWDRVKKGLGFGL